MCAENSEPKPRRGESTPAPPPSRPLSGRVLVITRAEEKGRTLADILAKRGAAVISIPTIRFEQPEDPAPLQKALARLGSYRWILFTSSTGVQFFLESARRHGIAEAAWARFNFGVVGVTTATQLASMGVRAERIIIASSAAALGDALVGPAAQGGAQKPLGPDDRCLLPQTNIARTDLQARLRQAGVPFESVIAYRTLPEPPEKARPFLDLLERGGKADGIAFASPSAFENFLAMTAPQGEAAIRGQSIPLFSIGPTTSQAIRERGFEVAREASPFNAEGLAEAIVQHLTGISITGYGNE
ncbi:MAG: uroporphyrinogen-III synthase [Planctomycetes bacterium]|nr:uroporphyrinogen-III synthase [Planctomycetota bacterium]